MEEEVGKNDEPALASCTLSICSKNATIIMISGCSNYCRGIRRSKEVDGSNQGGNNNNNMNRRQLRSSSSLLSTVFDMDRSAPSATEDYVVATGNRRTIILSERGHELANMFYILMNRIHVMLL